MSENVSRDGASEPKNEVAQNPETEVKELMEDSGAEKKAHKKKSKKSKKSKRDHKHALDDDLADIGDEKSSKELQREIAELQAQLEGGEKQSSKSRKRNQKRADKEAKNFMKHLVDDQADEDDDDEEEIERKANNPQRKAGKKKGANVLSDDEIARIAVELAQKMTTAVEQDNKNNQNRLPAINKYLLLDEVTRELRRSTIAQAFIEKGGCGVLGQWLEPLPDQTYPNVTVVQEILLAIEQLDIGPEELQNDNNLGRIVKAYSRNVPNMPSVVTIAKKIVDRWSRAVFNIRTTYGNKNKAADLDEEDDAYMLKDQYRAMRRQQARMNARKQRDEEGKEEDETPQENLVEKITRGRVGIIMPARNAFDFVERPSQQAPMGSGQSTGSGPVRGHERLRKVMTQLKKASKTTLVNRKMAIAKMYDN